jgi:proteic killer suppression protein
LARSVELKGLRKVRKISGYQDEPLKGDQQGQRSVRLSKGYRGIYVEENKGQVNLVIIEEVNKHEY